MIDFVHEANAIKVNLVFQLGVLVFFLAGILTHVNFSPFRQNSGQKCVLISKDQKNTGVTYLGDLNGYLSGNSTLIRHTPPSYGVSFGP